MEVRALDGVTIDFPETGMVFLLGRSGSGKSTLLNLCGGLDVPTGGEIIVEGNSSKTFTATDFDGYRNAYVGFVFQEYNLLEEFTVEQNIALALQLQNKPDDKAVVEEILKSVDLDDVSKRRPNTLSGGQRQRVAIARALVKNPKIIMADEPTGALDYNTGIQILSLLKKLSKTRLVLVVSHDRDFAKTFADRIIELADGKVVSDSAIQKENYYEDDNFSVIDSNTVKVKDWSKITDSDVEKLIATMKKRRVETVDKEKIVERTDDHSIKSKEFIKSRLPVKHTLKMAHGSIKSKPIRLAFTIFLAVIAFVFFGVSSTLVMYEPNYSIAKAIEGYHYESIVLHKNYDVKYSSYVLSKDNLNVVKKDNYLSFRAGFSKEDVNALNQNEEGLKFAGIMDLGYYKQAYGTIYDIQGYIGNDNEVKWYYLQKGNSNYYPFERFIGFSDCGHEFLVENDFELISGRYPKDHTEIAISKYFYEMLTKGRHSNYDDNYYNVSPDEFIGKEIKLENDFQLNVVGIYDVGEIPIRFNELNNRETKLDMYGIKLLKEEYNDFLLNSYHLVGFVSDDFYAEHKYEYLSLNTRQMYGIDFSTEPITEKVEEKDKSYVYTPDSFWAYKEVIKVFDFKGNEIPFNMEEDQAFLSMGSLYSEAVELYRTVKDKSEYEEFNNICKKLDRGSGGITPEDYITLYKTIVKSYESETGKALAIPEHVYYKNVKDEGGQLKTKGFYVFVDGTNVNAGNDCYLVSDSVCDKNEGKDPFNPNYEREDYQTDYKYDPLNEKYGRVIAKSDNSINKTLYMLKERTDHSYITMENNVYRVSINMVKIVSEMKTIFIVAGVVFGVFASLMLFNFISTSILQKKKEIGILRALGARKEDVFKIFMTETIIITLICFIISVALTYFACLYINYFMVENAIRITLLNYNIINVLIIFFVSFTVSLIATALPIIRASKKSPVDGIRAL